MTTYRLPNTWMDDPDDAAFVQKSEGRGLGAHALREMGKVPVAQMIATVASILLTCPTCSTEVTVAKSLDSGLCRACVKRGVKSKLAPKHPVRGEAEEPDDDEDNTSANRGIERNPEAPDSGPDRGIARSEDEEVEEEKMKDEVDERKRLNAMKAMSPKYVEKGRLDGEPIYERIDRVRTPNTGR